MKYETYSEYSPGQTSLAEKAFLTIWAGLGQWHENLVLIGGLVPKYLCGNIASPHALPHTVTLDVDLGIALATDSGQYGNLLWQLSGQGFKSSEQHPARFEKNVNGFTIPIDFLTEKPPLTSGTTQVEDITAEVIPGVNRALTTARNMIIEGIDLHDAKQKLTIRICEIGPFLALKLRAFLRRQQPKDAFDILYAVLHYDKGAELAITSFAEEIRQGNTAIPDALRALRELFENENAPGPAKASHFALGAISPHEPEDIKYHRARIRQDMVDIAARLAQ